MTAQNIWQLNSSEIQRQERRAQATVSFLDITTDDFILDVGCCEGFIANHFSKCSLVVGIDNSKVSLLTAKQNVRKSNVDFVLADINALPLSAESFDKITLLEVLEHLPKDKQRSLCGEIDQLLRHNGIFLISTPYKEQITYATSINCGKSTPLWGHLCSLDAEKISNLLPAGYSQIVQYHLPNIPLVSLSTVFQYLPFRFWSVLNNILGRFRKGYWIILKYKKS